MLQKAPKNGFKSHKVSYVNYYNHLTDHLGNSGLLKKNGLKFSIFCQFHTKFTHFLAIFC